MNKKRQLEEALAQAELDDAKRPWHTVEWEFLSMRSSNPLPDPLPEWDDDLGMLSWLMDEFYNQHQPQTGEPYIEIAKLRAREGDPEPLRSLVPDLAEFIFAPPWPRGKHKPSRGRPMSDAAKMAAAEREVVFIRGLWRQHYGKIKRYPDATWFAAYTWGLDEEELRDRLKSPHIAEG